MRIAYVGNFRPAFATETHLGLTLESLGHEVIRLQENLVTPEQVTAAVAEQQARLLLWTRTWGLEGDSGAMLAACAAMKVPTVSYTLDLYAPIPRSADVPTHPWWRCRYVFTADGGSPDFWRGLGVNHYYQPPAVYHGGCYLAEPDPAQTCDVLFVGSYNYHPEWPWRRRLIDWLRDRYGARFRHVPAPGTDAVREHALNVLYASTKVVVGDSLCPGFTHRYYTSDRLFETTGRGGFIVYPRIVGVTDGTLVKEGEHVACYDYGDLDGLGRTIDYYLEHPAEREAIRLSGHEWTKTVHTYQPRMRAMLQTVAGGEGWA